MAQTLQFDLVSPERSLASLKVSAVQIPGSEGDLTAMPGHMPLITTLRPGVVKVSAPDVYQEFVVTGGFAEIGDGLSILAENAVLRSEIKQSDFDQMIEEAENTLNKAKENVSGEPGLVDEMEKVMSDMLALGDEIDRSHGK